MADTLALTLTAQITEGTSTQTDKRTFTATDTAIVETVNEKFTIAAGATDLLVDLGEVASLKYTAVEFSGAIGVKIGSNTAPSLAFPASGFLCVSGAPITSIYVTNAGTAPVTATLIGGA
jgi:hypothetical protein